MLFTTRVLYCSIIFWRYYTGKHPRKVCKVSQRFIAAYRDTHRVRMEWYIKSHSRRLGVEPYQSLLSLTYRGVLYTCTVPECASSCWISNFHCLRFRLVYLCLSAYAVIRLMEEVAQSTVRSLTNACMYLQHYFTNVNTVRTLYAATVYYYGCRVSQVCWIFAVFLSCIVRQKRRWKWTTQLYVFVINPRAADSYKILTTLVVLTIVLRSTVVFSSWFHAVVWRW